MKFLKNKNILVISPEPWGHIPVSKHHYAQALARAGNKVFFLSPPSTEDVVLQTNVPNLFAIEYKTFRGINRLPSFMRNILNRQLSNHINSKAGGRFNVVWSFDPFRFQNLAIFNADINIYHAVDVHRAPLEEELARGADLLLSVSDMIMARFNHIDKPKKKVNHGVAPYFFDQPVLRHGNKPITVGYVGNLDNWCIDIPTLIKIVKSHPDINFKFIGPYSPNSYLAKVLSDMPHCKLVGRVPSNQLPAHFVDCSLFLMCYRGDEKDINSNHHKILEFLTTGCPVVMNYTDEYKDKRNLVFMSDSNEELPGLFSSVLNDLARHLQENIVQVRRNFALANGYDHHVVEIDNFIQQLKEK
ncbi:MAG: hypothetical protein ACOYXA_18080 [Bacteroidota bacterium]